jgi:hypothetical protein
MSSEKGKYGVSPVPSEPPAGWNAPTEEEFSKPTVEGTEELDAEAQVSSDECDERVMVMERWLASRRSCVGESAGGPVDEGSKAHFLTSFSPFSWL